MRIERYSGQDREWDDFVLASRNGTVFHLRKFLSYHPPDRFEDHSLLFYDDKNRLIAVLPACNAGGSLVSHSGASYGGLVLDREASSREVFEAVGELVGYAERQDFGSLSMRLAPYVFQRWPSEDQEYALVHHGFAVTETEMGSAINLRCPPAMHSSTKRSIRKAAKLGLVVEESEDWQRFWEILEKNLEDRHGTRPTHNLQEILRLKRLLPENILLFGAYLEGQLVAGSVMFVCNKNALHTFYFATDYRYQELRPLNLVVKALMDWGTEGGYGWLNLGISTENGGRDPNWGLFRFKEGFGARGTVRRYWTKDLV